jgi:hypothetical protein
MCFEPRRVVWPRGTPERIGALVQKGLLQVVSGVGLKVVGDIFKSWVRGLVFSPYLVPGG